MNERIKDQLLFFNVFKIGADFKSQHERDMGELLREVQPEDLLKFGLISEFIGRLNEAIERKSGACGLRAIMENTMLEEMYKIPSQSNIRECIISEEVVLHHESPILVYENEVKVA